MLIRNLKIFIFSLTAILISSQANASSGGHGYTQGLSTSDNHNGGGYGYTQGLSRSDNYSDQNGTRDYNQKVAPLPRY
jgi:hypothetical protein